MSAGETPLGLLRDLSESRLFPSAHSLGRRDAEELAELTHLHLVALRILLHDSGSSAWARAYCQRTSSRMDFRRWRTDATDLYVLLHGLLGDAGLRDRKFSNEFRNRLSVDATSIHRWLRHAGSGDASENETRRLFVRLDSMFRVQNPSMRAIRRLVLDWPTLNRSDQKLALTRLLQFIRARAGNGEIRPHLEGVAHRRGLEMHDVCDLETGKGCDPAAVTKESATAGGTSVASVAIVPGTIGAGFDPDGHRGVYEKRPQVIRRPALTK